MGLEPVRRYNCLTPNRSSRGILSKMRQIRHYKKGVSYFKFKTVDKNLKSVYTYRTISK